MGTRVFIFWGVSNAHCRAQINNNSYAFDPMDWLTNLFLNYSMGHETRIEIQDFFFFGN